MYLNIIYIKKFIYLYTYYIIVGWGSHPFFISLLTTSTLPHPKLLQQNLRNNILKIRNSIKILYLRGINPLVLGMLPINL